MSDPASKFKKWFPDLGAETLQKLVWAHAEFLNANKTFNFISQANLKNSEASVFADALHAARLIGPALMAAQPVYELGSGNGLPGFALAILYPKAQVILLERDAKKTEFYKHIASSLKLSNLTTLAKGLDDIAPGSVMNLVAKGFSPLSRALLATRKQVGTNGKFFHLKSDSWATELSSVPSQLFSVWAPSLLGQYRIPDSSVDMAVVLTQKLADS